MQLGGLKPEYAASTIWNYQATATPLYHEFFIDGFEFCGANILANYSNNWNVMVDTSNVCLTLPLEFYNSFLDWFNVSEPITDIDR